jgi:hypothetical protein
MNAREPANRPRNVNVRKNLLPTMTLKIKQNRTPAPAATTAPVHYRQPKARQKNIVDPAVKRTNNARQQNTRHLGTKLKRQMPGNPRNIALNIKRAGAQFNPRATKHPGPVT